MFRRSFASKIFVSAFLVFAIIGINSSLASAADEAAMKELKNKLIIANKVLDLYGLAKPLGHISVRVPGTDTFFITRGVAPGMAVLDDILICDLEGKVVEGKYPRSYGEVAAHAGVYKKRKDINSVAHIHPLYTIALSMTETQILPASINSFTAGPEPIAIWKKVAFVDNLPAAEEIADLLGRNNAVMLKGHGAVVVGKSLEDCTNNSVALENAAQLQLFASVAGKVVALTEQEKKPLVDYLTKAAGSGAARAWDYYEFLLKK
jgi:ribulose-5-phosphate 4-epimerase/fuculose-1-phosphate aldolase